MNERIRELAKQARQIGEYVNYGQIRLSPGQFEQKFAELIVKDCINISTKVDKNPYVPDHDQAKKIIREIKQHFGVE